MKTSDSQHDTSTSARKLLPRIFNAFGDSRSAKREPAEGRVTLNWRDRFGDGFAYGTCRDISGRGIGIECLEPIPLKAPVDVRLADGRSVKPAVIRYRDKRGSAYIMGLEFTSDRARREMSKPNELDLATDGMTW